MADNSYAQLIDDFEKGINVLKGETLTEYIKRMGGVDYESKADGGAIGIEVLFGPKRENFRGGGIYQGRGGYGASRSSQGPAGGASAGGNYGGNVNPNQTYGGGSGGNNQPPVIVPKKKPPVQVSGSDFKGILETVPSQPNLSKWLGMVSKYNPLNLIFGSPASAEEFDLEKLKEIGAAEKGWLGYGLTDKGKLLDDFTQSAIKMGTTGEEGMNPSLGAPIESITNRIMNMPGGTFKRFQKPENKAVIQSALDQGLLSDQKDFTTQKEFKEYFKKGGRVGFNQGGWADNLEGEAKGIYDSMTAYGASDAEIQAKLQTQGLWSPDGSGGGGGGTEQVTGIINQDIGGGGGGPGGPGAVTDFYESITERQNRLNNPGKIQGLINTGLDKLGINTQDSVQEMLSRGMRGPKDTRITSGIPFGISGMITRALPDNYYDNMTLGDQITTQSFMGYTDPNTNMANKDPFGLNVRSMFGNYVEKAAEIVDTLEAKLAKNGYLSPYDQKRFDHYKNVTTTKQNIAADLGLIELAKQQKAKEDAAKAAAQLAGVSELTGNVNTGGGKGIASSGVASGKVDPSGMGGGSRQATSAGAQKTDRDDGGWGWAQGGPVGLATMFTRRR